MWSVNGQNISMAENDYGIKLPITVNGTTFSAGDSIKIVFKTVKNGAVVLEKDFSPIVDNTINLEFTEEETNKFHIGSYVYSMDWYQDGNFMCNIIPLASLKVVDKA